jgi:SAM-dependent methyltransferase
VTRGARVSPCEQRPEIEADLIGWKVGSEKRPQNDQRRLYADLAWLWPIISPPEDYVDQSEQFVRLLREGSRIEVKTLLHLGCGGGHNDYTLKKHFEVIGVDLSHQMLKLARQLNPEVTYLPGDMRTVRLGKLFDAVVIFDSLYYMLTEDDLRTAFGTAYLHLKPGGVFLTYQEHDPKRFRQNGTTYSTHGRQHVEVTLIEHTYDPDPTDTTFETTMIYLIRRPEGLKIETDRHLGGLVPTETWLAFLSETGFEAKTLDGSLAEGCPTFVCTKPLAES